jgi:hypothetical protein
MNRIHRIGRRAGVLAGVLLASAAAAPAALAVNRPVPDGGRLYGVTPPGPASVTVVVGGMPGWQITLIALGAALLAATVAVFVDRAQAARRTTITTAACAVHADDTAPRRLDSGEVISQ